MNLLGKFGPLCGMPRKETFRLVLTKKSFQVNLVTCDFNRFQIHPKVNLEKYCEFVDSKEIQMQLFNNFDHL